VAAGGKSLPPLIRFQRLARFMTLPAIDIAEIQIPPPQLFLRGADLVIGSRDRE
jgi:hypothetical protein